MMQILYGHISCEIGIPFGFSFVHNSSELERSYSNALAYSATTQHKLYVSDKLSASARNAVITTNSFIPAIVTLHSVCVYRRTQINELLIRDTYYWPLKSATIHRPPIAFNCDRHRMRKRLSITITTSYENETMVTAEYVTHKHFSSACM